VLATRPQLTHDASATNPRSPESWATLWFDAFFVETDELNGFTLREAWVGYTTR
jgi:hypothetical protein